jgi:hypothetical protein
MDISLSFSGSGDEDRSLLLHDSSYEEDVEVICLGSNNTNDDITRHGGGSIKGKARNKNRNSALGHQILMQVSDFCLFVFLRNYVCTNHYLFYVVLFEGLLFR